jgi:hypothetical protein
VLGRGCFCSWGASFVCWVIVGCVGCFFCFLGVFWGLTFGFLGPLFVFGFSLFLWAS